MNDTKKDEADGVTQPESEEKQQATEADAAIDESDLDGVAGGGIILGGPAPTPGW